MIENLDGSRQLDRNRQSTLRALPASRISETIWRSSCLTGLVLLTLAMTPQTSYAAAYKCVDASGSISYSQIPCSNTETTSRVISTTVQQAQFDCRIAKNFAWRIAHRMHQGANSEVAFQENGGINSLSPSSIGIINYIYTFDGNPDVSLERISSLTTRRCEVGAFGVPSCDVFPDSFIRQHGGCEAAGNIGAQAQHGQTNRNAHYNATTQPLAASQAVSMAGTANSAHGQLSSGNDVFGGNTLGGSGLAGSNCRGRIKEKMATLREQMRNAQSISRQDQLREQRHLLGKQLNQC